MPTVAVRLASYRGELSEDRARVVWLGSQTLVAAIADGVGGQPGGGRAAQLVVETVEAEATTLARRKAKVWPGFFHALDDALTAQPEAGQTTLVALELAGQYVTGASVGDSEAWWVTAGGHYDLTEAQRRKPFLGQGVAEPVSFALTLTEPGMLLIATDGLFKYADPLAITEAVRQAESVESAADALLTLASSPAGRLYDDLALVLIRVDTIAPWTRFLKRFREG